MEISYVMTANTSSGWQATLNFFDMEYKKYKNYKTFIRKAISNVMSKQKTVGKKIKNQLIKKEAEASINIDKGPNALVTVTEPPSPEEKPHGHFEGTFWVWPNGQKTHVRFIDQAIRQMKPLPRGFYEEAEKETYLTNMKNMLRKAKQLKLPDSVDIRQKE